MADSETITVRLPSEVKQKLGRLAERTAAAMAKQPPRAFSWIRDRAV